MQTPAVPDIPLPPFIISNDGKREPESLDSTNAPYYVKSLIESFVDSVKFLEYTDFQEIIFYFESFVRNEENYVFYAYKRKYLPGPEYTLYGNNGVTEISELKFYEYIYMYFYFEFIDLIQEGDEIVSKLLGSRVHYTIFDEHLYLNGINKPVINTALKHKCSNCYEDYRCRIDSLEDEDEGEAFLVCSPDRIICSHDSEIPHGKELCLECIEYYYENDELPYVPYKYDEKDFEYEFI